MKQLSSPQLMTLFLFGIFFAVVGIIGGVIPSYITTMLGFNLSSFLFIFLGIVLHSKKEQPEILTPPILWFGRILSIGFGIFQLVVLFPFWKDLPEYMNKEYVVIEGYPTDVIYDPGGWSKYDEPTLYVTIDGKKLLIDLYPENPDELYEKYLRIVYLPETEWIVSISMK